nr:FAD-dependent oxidoreductase [Streptomyces sp. CJ_13]
MAVDAGAGAGAGADLDVDVAVVGAGPVGLSAALLLARAGLGVVVLERRPGPVTESRATDLLARTLEALTPSGLAESLHPLGRRMDTVEMWSRGRRLGGFDLSRLRTPYPYPHRPAMRDRGPAGGGGRVRGGARIPLRGRELGPRGRRRRHRTLRRPRTAARPLGGGGRRRGEHAPRPAARPPRRRSPPKRRPGDGRLPSANAAGRVPSAPGGASPRTTGADGCC